ncbi:DNAJ-like molecular chaperone protein, putative [Babesia caballi]|uniref:DNAJ-like molecular chaperone protein, putative n=1 Tax=Babesia caballi TaxID=5871 RepID=A0AAV4M083_BABCB|nr:DNAJ-like molecular chaperone protein, putative [Babesia caballi]
MGINALIGHHLIGAAATHTLLVEPNFFSKWMSQRIRFAVVAVVASVLVWQGLPDTGESLYAKVGLPVTASQYDIVTLHARTRMDLQVVSCRSDCALTLQKNGATDNAAELRSAFEVLVNEEKRNVYNRFGDMQSNLIGDVNLPVVSAALALSFYILSSVLCIAFFSSAQLAFTRYLMFLYSAVAFALEMECRFVKNSSVFTHIYYVNEMLPFQQIALLRGLAPATALLINLFCAYFYVDTDRLQMFLWHSAVTTNRVLLERMTDLVDATNYIKSLPSPSTAHLRPAAPSASNDEKPKETANVEDSSGDAKPQAGGKSANSLKEILESMDDAQREKVAELLKISPQKPARGRRQHGRPQGEVGRTALLRRQQPRLSEHRAVSNSGNVSARAPLTCRQYYNSVNGQGLMQKVEIVYVSCDTEREAFRRNVQRMPWLHIDFDDGQLPALRHKYNVIDSNTGYGTQPRRLPDPLQATSTPWRFPPSSS